MNRLQRHGVFVALLAIFAAAPAIVARSDTNENVAQLVAELGSGDFAARQRATAALADAGADAMVQLERAAGSTDAEVRRRALSILFAHSLGSLADCKELARGALERVSNSSVSPAATAARETLDRIREVVASTAAAELTRLGATVMPVQTGEPLVFNVQIRQTWNGGDERMT